MKLDQRMLLLAAVAACAALSLPAVATADDDKDVRKAGTCTASSRINIRLRADGDEIRIDLEIRTQQRNGAWSVILLRERRTVFQGRDSQPRQSHGEASPHDRRLVRPGLDRRAGLRAATRDVSRLGHRLTPPAELITIETT